MAEARRSVDGFAAGAMLLLCTIWGLQQVAVKVAAPDIAPIMQLALRSAISAALCWSCVGYFSSAVRIYCNANPSKKSDGLLTRKQGKMAPC